METNGNIWASWTLQPVLVVWRKRTLKIAFKETNVGVLVLRRLLFG